MQSSAPLYTNAQHVINLAALRVGSAIMHHRQYQALPMDVLYVGICRELVNVNLPLNSQSSHYSKQLVHTIIGYLIMSGIPHSVPPVIAKAGRWVRHTGALSDISDEEASEIPASKADMDELSWWLLTSPSKTTLESPLNVDSIPQKVRCTTGNQLCSQQAVLGHPGPRHQSGTLRY
jgi:hypothetical protein